MELSQTEEAGPEDTGFGATLLTPGRRVVALELALDALTVQIANQGSIISTNPQRIKLLQGKVRLIASQIRSYEKLEALKKSLGLAGATLGEKPEGSAEESETVLEEAATMSRAARRRLKRLEVKQAKKNKAALRSGAAAPVMSADAPANLRAAR